MIKAIFLGKEISYNGKITSIGEYSSRISGYKVWMGKTSHGFIYASYKDDDYLVLQAKEATDMLRFMPFDKAVKDIHFSKELEIPEICRDEIVYNAIQLLNDDRDITCLDKELAKRIENL